GLLGHALGGRVAGVDQYRYPAEADLGESPPRQEPHRLRRDAAPARPGTDQVSDLPTEVLPRDHSQVHRAEQLAVARGHDGERDPFAEGALPPNPREELGGVVRLV